MAFQRTRALASLGCARFARRSPLAAERPTVGRPPVSASNRAGSPGRAERAVGWFLVFSTLLFAFWTLQQVDLEISKPSPLSLLALTSLCLAGALLSFGRAIYLKRRARRVT